MSNYLKAFNNHLIDFMDDILAILKDNDHNDMKTYKVFVENIIKTNSLMVIKIWKNYVVDIYIDKILNDDFDFFLNKDYNEISGSKQNIENLINKIKNIVVDMNDSNKKKSLKYIKNLCKLCNLYFNK